MDPGDWADQYPLLNAWTSFTNDAFYNNPTEAISKRGGTWQVRTDFRYGQVGQGPATTGEPEALPVTGKNHSFETLFAETA